MRNAFGQHWIGFVTLNLSRVALETINTIDSLERLLHTTVILPAQVRSHHITATAYRAWVDADAILAVVVMLSSIAMEETKNLCTQDLPEPMKQLQNIPHSGGPSIRHVSTSMRGGSNDALLVFGSSSFLTYWVVCQRWIHSSSLG